MIAQWNEKYSLNNKKIDDQHKELFRLAALVDTLGQQTTKEEIKDILHRFFSYMKEHFESEESFMSEIDYPLIKGHKRLHAEIIEEFTKLIKENHSLDTLKEKMKDASQKWLVNHILENDLKIKRWREMQEDLNKF